MTINEIQIALRILNANYGREFYRDMDETDVIKEWAAQFGKDDPNEVMQAIQNCISTFSYRPVIADIRRRMAKNRTKGQMTEMQAFQAVKDAMRKSTNRENSVAAFNNMPPILRKLVGRASQLRDWQNISDESFETVIASQIMRSYRTLAEQEADYYALPAQLQTMEPWRIEAPEPEALPEPEITKTVDQIIDEANQGAAEHGMVMTDDLKRKNAARVDAFLKPVTKDEEKALEFRDQQRLERMFR